MATASDSTTHTKSRFLDANKEDLKELMPLKSFDDVPLLPLGESVEKLDKLHKDLKLMIDVALKRSKDPADNLNEDQSAAICLYTMEGNSPGCNLYSLLNATLRNPDRTQLESWYPYLKLILTALYTLPSISTTVWRGVRKDLSHRYKRGEDITWWAFSSCTTLIDVLEDEKFLGTSGERTLFAIECCSGKEIKRHSYYSFEKEVLLLPTTHLKVLGQFKCQNDMYIIHLREIPTQPLLIRNILCEQPRKPTPSLLPISVTHEQWTSTALTVAGGHGYGQQLNQFSYCYGMCVDSDGAVLIADLKNHRIVEWKFGATSGQIIAGGHGEGSEPDQLNKPTDVIFDHERNSILICDRGNRRVVRWPRQNGKRYEMVIENIDCGNLAMDNYGFFYVTDTQKDKIRRYQLVGNSFRSDYKTVAGGNEEGKGLNQFNGPACLFVDCKQTVYVSDKGNNRVMKWVKDATEGIVVAGGEGKGNGLRQLNNPLGLFVDLKDNIYIVDSGNHRIVCWSKNSDVRVILGGNYSRNLEHGLNGPTSLAVDSFGNLYIYESENHRVQRFAVKSVSNPQANIVPNPTPKVPSIKWKSLGVTVAGGHGSGSQLNQLNQCYGLFVDDDGNILIADSGNHRIVEWKPGATNGQVIAGGKGKGANMNQLNCPTSIVVDKNTNSLLICDSHNRRIVRWPRRQGQVGCTVVANIDCYGLAMGKGGCLYVTDIEKNEVRCYQLKQNYSVLTVTRVAGGNGKGDNLNQLDRPDYLFVDQDDTIFISDTDNHRVMKWTKGKNQGVIVAGGKGAGNNLEQLCQPTGLFVNSFGTIYVADSSNHRVTRWHGKQSDLIADGTIDENGKNHPFHPEGLAVDRHDNLYVADWKNHRVLRFAVRSE